MLDKCNKCKHESIAMPHLANIIYMHHNCSNQAMVIWRHLCHVSTNNLNIITSCTHANPLILVTTSKKTWENLFPLRRNGNLLLYLLLFFFNLLSNNLNHNDYLDRHYLKDIKYYNINKPPNSIIVKMFD